MAETMLAAVFEGVGQLTLKDMPIPKIARPDQVKIEIEAIGICGTDVHICAVPPAVPATVGTILGHEFVGVVVDKGADVTHLKVGDRVVANPNDYCGNCVYCRMERPNMCENMGMIGLHVHGGFAKYIVVSGKLAFKIADSVPVDQGAFAEMLADVVNGTSKAALRPGESAVVIGAGPIGQLYAQMFRVAGASKVILADTAPYRLDYSRKMGFDLVVDPSKEDFKQYVLAQTGIGADVVVDAVGSALATAIDVAAKGARVIAFGLNMAAIAQFQQFQITGKELSVLGAWLANSTFPPAIKILESGALNIDGLISHTMPLTDIHQGLALLRNREALKIVVHP
jgi:L-iditol 2-dehydrogenase